MGKTNLMCINDGSSTFLHNGLDLHSWLDNTLVSNHLVSKCEWEVLNYLNSDHIPVLTYFDYTYMDLKVHALSKIGGLV